MNFKEVPVYLKDTIQLSVREKLVKKILCKGSQSDNLEKTVTNTSEVHSKHIHTAGSHQQAGEKLRNQYEGQVKVEPHITDNGIQWNLVNQNEGQVKVEPQITENGMQSI